MPRRRLLTLDNIIAAHAFELGGKPLDWIHLLPAGRFEGRDGRGPYDTADGSAQQAIIAATLKRAGTTELVIDYDHQTLFASNPNVGGRAPAAGWIKEYAVRDDGIWARVEWTAAAAEAIVNKEYRYISPVITHDRNGKVRLLVSAALTNTPNLDLAAVAASVQDTGENMEEIAKALGLPETASVTDILVALNARMAVHAVIVQAAGLSATATGAELVTAIQAATKPDPAKFVPIDAVVAMQAELNKAKADDGDRDAVATVEKAIAAGTLIPALRDWGIAQAKSNPAAFATFAATAPKIVTPGGAGGGKTPAEGGSLTDADKAVCSAMELDETAFLAAKKKEIV